MEYLIGVILTLAVAAFAAVVGFDRERAFYPTVLIVIASYYALFAVRMSSPGTTATAMCCSYPPRPSHCSAPGSPSCTDAACSIGCMSPTGRPI